MRWAADQQAANEGRCMQLPVTKFRQELSVIAASLSQGSQSRVEIRIIIAKNKIKNLDIHTNISR